MGKQRVLHSKSFSKPSISGLAVVILLGVLFILFVYIVNWMNLYLYINNKP